MQNTTIKRSSRVSKGGLRRHCMLENVTVDEPFTFAKPSQSSGNCSKDHNCKNNSIKNRVADQSVESESVGHGCYVSYTTAQNKRYYGVLIEQSALMAASDYFLKDEADSLQLNKRMEVILDLEAGWMGEE